jgi:hypothetical protein
MRCLLPISGDQPGLLDDEAIERTSLEFRCCAVILASSNDLAFLLHEPGSGVACVSDDATSAE